MEKFTFEELCLMRIFDTTTHETLRNELLSGLHDADETTEPELLGLFGSTLEKLEALTDEEYITLVFYLDIKDFYDDNIDERDGLL